MEYRLTFEAYQKAIKEGKILGLRCGHCGTFHFPPRSVCTHCGGRDLEKKELSGEGTIRTFTVIRVPPEGMKPSYIVAMVALEEGPWVTGRVVDMNPDEADMGIMGKRVRLGSQPAEGHETLEESPHVLTFTII